MKLPTKSSCGSGRRENETRFAFFLNLANQLFHRIAWQDENVTLARIVNEDQSMQMIRDAANECLEQLHVSYSFEELLVD